MTIEHQGLTYEEVAVPAEHIRLIFPRNTFTAKIVGGHAEITISTDLAGIPAVIKKLEALVTVMAVEINQPEIIERFSVEATPTPDAKERE